jgi:hypothetical protein
MFTMTPRPEKTKGRTTKHLPVQEIAHKWRKFRRQFNAVARLVGLLDDAPPEMVAYLVEQRRFARS